VEALLSVNPKIGVLMISGVLNPGLADDLRQTGAKGSIKKQFDVSHLLEKIRKIIDEE
jgi:DNA-binding NarL/FixJ family response regulator